MDHSGKARIQSKLCSPRHSTPLESRPALAVAQEIAFFAGEDEIVPFEGVQLENSLQPS